MIGLLIGLLIVCLLIYIVWWAISQMNLPQPVRVIAVVVLALIALMVLLNYFPLSGLGLHSRC